MKADSTRDTLIGSLLILFAFGLLAVFIVNLDWEFADWTQVFYPAAQRPLSPYFPISPDRALYYFNPPWLAWLLFPFTLLPPRIALALFLLLTILVTMWCVHRLGGGLLETLLVLCSPAFVRLFIHAQIDGLMLLGFTLLLTAVNVTTKGIGLVLMAIKPQVLSFGAILYWWQLERHDKIKILLPLLGVTAVSLLIHGLWPLEVSQILQYVPQNANVSVWPYGVPVGVVLLIVAVWRRDVYLAGLATFFFTPYLSSHSLFAYTAVLFTQLSKKWATAVFVLLWILALLAT